MSLLAAATTSPPGHGVHVLAGLAFLVLTLGGVAVGEAAQRARQARRQSARPSALLRVIGIAGVAGAAVHYFVTPEHLENSTLYGVFFVVVATVQLGYSVLVILRPSRLLLATGIAANLSLVALWLLSRVVAIPLGPAAGTTESFGLWDVLASSSEFVVVIAASLALRQVSLPNKTIQIPPQARVDVPPVCIRVSSCSKSVRSI